VPLTRSVQANTPSSLSGFPFTKIEVGATRNCCDKHESDDDKGDDGAEEEASASVSC
jgi:hypothetical protein